MPFIQTDRTILFVHIPKCAGSSVEAWMRGHASLNLWNPMPPAGFKVTPQHLTAADLRAVFDDGFFDYAFATVRDPYARVESQYHMRMGLRSGPATPPFSSWLAHHIEAARRNPFVLGNHMRPQADFVDCDMRIFRLEDGLERAIAQVTRECELPERSIGHERRSAGAGGSIRWTGKDRILVNAFYAADFDLFGYERIAPDIDVVERDGA